MNFKEDLSKEADLSNDQVPECLYWDCEQVCTFFDDLGLPQYKETLRSNRIDGKRMIYLDASHLTKIGVNDWQHILHVTKNVRELLKLENPFWNRSIQDWPRDKLELYLEAKSFLGYKSSKLNYKDFLENTKDSKWQPPLTNQGNILPSF